jgi:membrane protein DedA with SNARE-associated domain
MFSEDAILSFLSQYAYMPLGVYAFVVLFMLMSGFGFPIPEEIVLVSCGLIAYMSLNPSLYPPPTPGAESVDVYVLATVCFFAVLLSDTVVYLLGRKHGAKVFFIIAKIRYFFMTPARKSETTVEALYQKSLNSPTFTKINELFKNHGMLAVGIFRFTPGIRFPGHLSCGMMGVSIWKFLLVDFIVAILSVPTQVLFVAFYGEVILDKFREFKIIILSAAAVIIVIYLIKKYRKKKSAI